MKTKVIILGIGEIANLQIQEDIIKAAGQKIDVVIVDAKSDIMQLAEELVAMKPKEVQQLIELDKIEPIHLQECYYEDVCKRNSQQGWKNIPKHKR